MDIELQLGFKEGNRVGMSITFSAEFIRGDVRKQIFIEPLPYGRHLCLLEVYSSEHNATLPPPRLHASNRGR